MTSLVCCCSMTSCCSQPWDAWHSWTRCTQPSHKRAHHHQWLVSCRPWCCSCLPPGWQSKDLILMSWVNHVTLPVNYVILEEILCNSIVLYIILQDYSTQLRPSPRPDWRCRCHIGNYYDLRDCGVILCDFIDKVIASLHWWTCWEPCCIHWC